MNNLDINFLFCSDVGDFRPSYWKIPLGDKCEILNPKKMINFGKNRYVNLDISKKLNDINPDVVIIGGFTIPTYYLAYLWAKRHRKKIAVFTEISIHPWKLKLYKLLFRKIHAILAVGNKAVKQYENVFKKKKVFNFSYPTDISERLKIQRREEQIDNIRFLYASRFIKNYNPEMVIKSFYELSRKYNNIKLNMSSNCELKDYCKRLVKSLVLEDKVTFIDDISSWDEVNNLYKENDILVFPASFNSWGLVIPEAMAAGMPIITTPYVIGSELLDCHLIQPEQSEIYNAMESYIIDKKKIYREGSRNRELSLSQTFIEKENKLKHIISNI
jgi:glycosyltransferase involved in cell wall biosynthesis